MLKIIHIFVVLIGFNMATKENINVPGATAIPTLCVETDKPFAEGTPYCTDMKMIEDLGVCLLPNERVRRHYAIYECPYCKKVFISRTDRVKEHPNMSCGCERIKHVAEKSFRHGLYKHPLHEVWREMKDRCGNPNNQRYGHYGSKGVIVCAEWTNDFKTFYDWSMANGYRRGLQINRIDNDGIYSPENCEFTNCFVNNQNNSLLRSNNTSGYRGVAFMKKGVHKKWKAQITSYGKNYSLGWHYTAKEAAQAYNDFVITHKTNHPLNKL